MQKKGLVVVVMTADAESAALPSTDGAGLKQTARDDVFDQIATLYLPFVRGSD